MTKLEINDKTIAELKVICMRLEYEKNERIKERDQYHTERDRLAYQLEQMQLPYFWKLIQLFRVGKRLMGKIINAELLNVLMRKRSYNRSGEITSAISNLQIQIDAIAGKIQAEGWEGHWILSHRWHTVKELSMGVAACYGYGIEGDIAEFGTMSGVSAEGLARAISANDKSYRNARPVHLLPNKRLFLFDSFEGLPPTEHAVDAESLHVKEGTWSAGTCRGLSKSELYDLIGKHLESDRYEIHEGWFKNTVPNLPKGQKFAILHVDGDLYSSTMDCLAPLFENNMIAEGALIYFDDWSPNRCSPNYGERRAWKELVERFNVVYSDDGSYSLLARRFVVHSYNGMCSS